MTIPSRPLKELFLSALEVPPDDRAEWLERECAGDVGLRNQLKLMLAAHDAPHSLLDQPSMVELGATLDLPITEKSGTVIGPYKLLQEIGHGGMGVVYMAEQTEPVERRVALKIIKPGMDTRQVIARFEAERQALAMMDHPNIAKVLDAGTTDSGRPYFVMELVKGTPITEYCDEHHLSPRQRLELFVPVCQAVQHAHQKGIIHRDIKPSNVLVAEYDDRAVPKIIDFGVAKAIEHRLTEKTMFTELGQVVGTPEYMSPEQAKLNQLDIDTRSDIYSLGVLLYELLIGETPFDRQRLRSAAFDELLRIIREEDPPRPSIRLSTSETLPSIAANRHTEPKRLSALVCGELDWIVMKAMEKDRTRRYETANGFAADIQRYLDDERVEACPPSVAYRFRKFAGRNKAAMATTAIVAVSLIAGMIGTGWQAGRAIRQRDRAIVAEAMAESKAEIATAAEQQTRQESERAKKAESKALTEAARADEEARKAVSAAERERSARVQAQQHVHDTKMQLIADAYDDANRPRMLQLLSESRAIHDSLPFEWRYWWRQCHRFVQRIDVRTAQRVALSPDGRTLMTGHGFDGILRDEGEGAQVWDLETGQLLTELLPEPTENIVQHDKMAVSPDGKLFAVLERTKSVPNEVKRWRVRVWDRSSQKTRTLIEQECGARFGFGLVDFDGDLAFSPDSTLLAIIPGGFSASDRRHEVLLARASTGEVVHVIHPQQEADVSSDSRSIARCMEFSPDGSLLAVAGMDPSQRPFLQLWNCATGQLQRNLPLRTDPSMDTATAYAVQFLEDGTQLLVQSREQYLVRSGERTEREVKQVLITFGVLDGRELERRPLPPGQFGGYYLWLNCRNGLIAGVREGSASPFLTEFPAQRTEVAIPAYPGNHRAVTFSEDGTMLVTGEADDSVKCWDITSDRLGSDAIVVKGLSREGYNLFAFDPDGASIATCSQRGTIEFWDSTSWQRTRILDYDYLGEANAVAISPDGRTLATSGRDRESGRFCIDVRDLATDTVRRIGEHHNKLTSLEFSPDGEQLASCDWIGSLHVWSFPQGKLLLAEPPEHAIEQWSGRAGNYGIEPQQGDLCFAADSGLFVSTDPAPVRLLDIETGRDRAQLPKRLDMTESGRDWISDARGPIARSHAGHLIAVPDYGVPPTDGAKSLPIRLIDPNTWKVRYVLSGHSQFVHGLAFSPDDARLVSTTQKEIIVWSVSTGEPVLTLRNDASRFGNLQYSAVGFSPNGQMLALAGSRDELRVIRVATDQEIETGHSQRPTISDFERAETLERRQLWAKAIESYTRAIERFPNDDVARWGRARCYKEIGKHNSALEDYQRLVALWSRYGVSSNSQDTLRAELRVVARASEQEKQYEQALSARQLIYDMYESSEQDNDRLRKFPLVQRVSLEEDHPLPRYALLRNSRDFILSRADLAEAYTQAGQPLPAISHWCAVLAELAELKGGYDATVIRIYVGSPELLRSLENRAVGALSGLLAVEGNEPELQARLADALNTAVEANQGCPALLVIRARVYVDLQEWDKAVADYTKAIERNPTDHTLYGHRADSYLAMASYDLALNDGQELVRLKPLSPWGHRIQGQALLATENYDEAISALSEALRLDPANTFSRKLRARAYTSLGQYDKAIADYTESIELNPNDHALYASRAELHSRLENYDQAIRDCDKALSLRPEDPAWALIRAQILVMAGRTEEYRQACQTMLDRFGQSTEPNDFCHAARVWILAPDAIADPKVPVELATRAASEDPRQWILYVLGMAYFRAGRHEDAARSFHESLDKDPEWPGIALNWLGLAMVEQARGETEAARQWLTKATTAMKERSAAAVQARLESALLLREIQRLLEESAEPKKENTDTNE